MILTTSHSNSLVFGLFARLIRDPKKFDEMSPVYTEYPTQKEEENNQKGLT